MTETRTQAFAHNFLGQSPDWYKYAIIGFLIINPLVFFTLGGTIAGWMLIIEFIFTLAMALKCYPLQPGGLLAIEAIAIGMSSPATVLHEITTNLEVILLLMFMVAGIYFLQSMLLFVFSRILLNVRSKIMLSLMFSIAGAFLSAFLDALTVTAVVIAVGVGFVVVGDFEEMVVAVDFDEQLVNQALDDTRFKADEKKSSLSAAAYYEQAAKQSIVDEDRVDVSPRWICARARRPRRGR